MAKKTKSEQATSGPVVYWLNEIAAARKREKEWRKDGERILEIYAGEKKDEVPFNILFSNTETLLPALYSMTPRAVVARRFKDEQPIAKEAAKAGERALSFLLDTNVDGYETFDEAMRGATLDALLPGRGNTTVKYDAEIGELPTESVDDEEPAGEDDEQREKSEPTPYKKSELVCCETRSWNRVFYGYAKKWSKVPWIAYEEHIDKQEAIRLFGQQIADALNYTTAEDDDDEDGKKKQVEAKGEAKTVCIYQIWDKDGGRKIRYVCDQRKEAFLKVEEDPLGITGFFNQPKPMQFIEKSNDLTPTAPYLLYENQAEELNRLTVRINRLLEAIKARGVYDSELGDELKNILALDDNQLTPADKTSSLAAEKGLQNAIWFWPVDKLIQVLRELYVAREGCKQVIFEIMGLADIMRGASQASETLGAQEIKQAWGGLRLKRTQKEVQRYARDLLRMMLEIAASKFSEETWARMTGLPYLTQQQFVQLQQMAQAAQMQMQQMMQMQPPAQPPMPGQPPAPPNPQMQQMQQQMQQLQQQLQTPKWADVLGLLKDDIQRSYKVDIETNSTVEPEAVEDQKNIAEVMNALGQFLNGIGPLVEKGVMPFQAAQSMMLAIVRRYRFGDEIEDYIKAMQAPKPQDDGKAKAEQQKAAAEMKKMEVETQQAQQEGQIKLQIAQQQAQIEQQKMQRESEFQAAEHQMKMAELQAKGQLAQIVAASKLKVALATAAVKERESQRPEPAGAQP